MVQTGQRVPLSHYQLEACYCLSPSLPSFQAARTWDSKPLTENQRDATWIHPLWGSSGEKGGRGGSPSAWSDQL